MKKSPSEQLRLGIFVVLGSVLFTAAMYFVGNKQSMFRPTSRLSAIFNNVNGLQPGNNVRYSGIEIGTVKFMEMINDTTIRVDMAIERTMMRHIKQDAIATISSDGLVGSMVINIIPGKNPVAKLVSDGDIIKSYSRIRTDDILKTLTVTNENAAMLTADLLKISGEILEGKGSVGLLLKDTVMARDMKETIRYLKISSIETSKSVDKLNRLLTSLDSRDNVIGVIKDTAVAHQIKSVIANLDQSAHRINAVVENMNGVVNDVKRGKGAINYLTQDPKSAQKMDSLISNANDATKLLKQDLEAIKHNFLLRGYFKKQEKAKRKAEQDNR